ncbi:MAG: Endonuclease/exonuclease/phosphatase [Pedosphaera sp.]|nr:Endonuclease/exonuclease/phosphatase [Pedosphaera sp.]
MVNPLRLLLLITATATTLSLPATIVAADTFRIAQYNVENYLDAPTATRTVKPDAAKAKVRESILALAPDVLALEEIGTTNALLELQASLKTAGLDLPYWEHVTGFDTNIHVAVLSKFPFTARHPHTNDSFLLAGRRFQVSRGFADLDIQVNKNYSFTLLATHLKSRRPIPAADEAELRFEEAKVLREIIDTHLAAKPDLNLIVLGDFNDLHDSEPIRTILGGRGKNGLLDTRPAERNGDDPPHTDRRINTRKITWTHYYAKDDTYSRIDYILLSHAMAREWDPAQTYILTLPNWGTASDHRPLLATFTAIDK